MPGDIVKIKPGDIIPADMVLIKSSNLRVSNEYLSGTKAAVLRSEEKETKYSFLNANNTIFYCSKC